MDGRSQSADKIMEEPTPFDLNEAIRRWQQNLGASPAFAADNLEELASHLCASVQRLKEAGLSEEESFLVASRRLGGADALNCEFSKLNRDGIWRVRASWMLAGMLVYWAACNLATLTSVASMTLCSHFLENGFLLGWIGAAACFAVIVSAAYLFHLAAAGRLSGTTPAIARLLQRRWIALPVLLGGAIALRAAAGGAEVVLYRVLPPTTVGQALVVNAWLNSVGGIVVILAIVVALTGPALLRHARSGAFSVGLLLFAGGVTLLAAGCGRGAPAPADSKGSATAGSGQTVLEQSMASWKDDQNAAVAKFLEVDWSRRPLFSTGNVLNDTEAQFAAIPAAAQQAVANQMTEEIKTVREICTEVSSRGKVALAKGDRATAEKCFRQLKQCGEALDGPDSLLILKKVGKSVSQRGAEALEALKK